MSIRFTEQARWISTAATAAIIVTINCLMLMRLGDASPIDSLLHLPVNDLLLWGTMNVAMACCCFMVRWHFSAPLSRMMAMLNDTSSILEQPTGHLQPAHSTTHGLLQELTKLSSLVKEHSAKRRELHRELESVRAVLAQYSLQQDVFLRSTNREIVVQYQAVLGYANYLDEHIASHTEGGQLRFDFDDVCESSFNLKLIAGALELLRANQPPRLEAVPLALLMQQTLLALAPSLDRRAMQLTTTEVDETVLARADPVILSQVVWMMLLGLVRYAADESTLRMRCFHDRDRKRALLSIVVSELAPGAMSAEERTAHLLRQMQHNNAHMFAETIKIHGNIQLAELLLAPLDAEISVVPLSPYACEIYLTLLLA